MPPKACPSLQKTIAFIKEILASDPAGLPSVRSIASMCRVSSVIVSRAMKVLAGEEFRATRDVAGIFRSGNLPAR